MEGSAFASKWGALPSKSDEDARCLALGCKLQMLVSLGVFGMIKSLYLPNHDQVSLSTVHKEIYTDHTEISLRGPFKLEPHPHGSPLRGLI